MLIILGLITFTYLSCITSPWIIDKLLGENRDEAV